MFMVRSVALCLLPRVAVDAVRVRSARTKGQPSDPDPGSTAADLFEAARQQAEEQPRFILFPGDFAKCHLSESECKMEDMTEATLVYTDSNTSRCFNGEPFAFLVHPGRRDKLLYYFPNGGACWEFPFVIPGSTRTCLPNMLLGLSVTGYGMGITDYSKTENSFRDYTFISPPYCSGGAHVANTTVEGLLGESYQHDYNNNEFAMSWARRNLAQTLEQFVIAGSSAGAIGTMAWSHYLLQTFQYKKATVIVDSYVGVFPEGTVGPIMKRFGVCNLPMFTKFKGECEAEKANAQDIFDYAIEQNPRVAFAIIQPKWDLAQRAFYSVIALTYLKLDLYMKSTRFYQITNSILERYARHPNFVHYYVAGGFHTFLWWTFYHTATVKGEVLMGGDGKPSLQEWTDALIKHQPVQSQCYGPMKPNGGDSYWWNTTRYCYEKLYPKTLRLA